MIRKALWTILGVVLALAFIAFVPYARADERNQASQLTFNQPVELPGNHVLPAGTYWFEVPDAVNSGNTVQIFNADRTQVLLTLQAIPVQRTNITDDTQLTFGRVYNQPLMLTSWFYPGETFGHEFLYSPEKESQLSEGNQIIVMARSGSPVSAG
jgi:hypothetical protein